MKLWPIKRNNGPIEIRLQGFGLNYLSLSWDKTKLQTCIEIQDDKEFDVFDLMRIA